MFLAHASSIGANSFHVLNQFNQKKILANVDNEFRIISNVCPHQNSLISTKDGQGNRVCPYHNWSFSLSGMPITSGRTSYYCENKNPLENNIAYVWNSLIFEESVNFDIDVDFKNMSLVESRVDTVNADYRAIMDLFLDVDHIQSVHAGVYDLIDITNTEVSWKYYNNGSVQTVDQGALWIAVYPYTMIEWQKGSLFITVTKPNGSKSDVFVFKYLDNRYSKDWKLNEFVWETAWSQDKAQAELIQDFPIHNLEPQKTHFRNYLNSNGIN